MPIASTAGGAISGVPTFRLTPVASAAVAWVCGLGLQRRHLPLEGGNLRQQCGPFVLRHPEKVGIEFRLADMALELVNDVHRRVRRQSLRLAAGVWSVYGR